jgi:hypothetical protein
MTTIQLQLPFDALLDSLQQLSADELGLLAQYAARLRAQQRTPNLSQAESRLLTEIGQCVVPMVLQTRCAELTARQRTQGLSVAEQAELMQLVDEIETVNATRLKYLVELANLWQTTLDDVIARLDIKALDYG